jgi:phage terminase large subunit-like protein
MTAGLTIPPVPPGGDAFGAYWDEGSARAACDFFPTYLRHTEAEWAGRPFVLADWQRDRIIRPTFGWKRADGSRLIRIVWLEVPRKNGKGLALDTPVPTPSGWTTIGELNAGGLVFDDCGLPCRVTYVSPVHTGLRCWRLGFSDGSSIVADEEHRWATELKWRPWEAGSPVGDRRAAVVTTPQIAASVRVPRAVEEHNHRLPPAVPLELPGADLAIDPYVLGYWLGNGHNEHARVYCADDDAAAVAVAMQRGHGIGYRLIPEGRGTTSVSLAGNGLMPLLRDLGVLGDKHVPMPYLRASGEQRMALLQGLLDSDGTVGRNGGQTPRVYFTTVTEQLARGTLELIRSLGIKATIREDVARICGRDIGPCWEVSFHGTSDLPLFRLERKQALLPPPAPHRTRSSSRHVVECEEVASVSTRCIQVDSPSHLFLAGEGMVATHNTELAAGISLLALLGDAEMGGQVYSMAVDKNQAKIVFQKAGVMVGYSETLRKHLEVYTTSIFCPELVAAFKPLSAGPHGKHGFSPSAAIGDEVHEWPNGELADVVHKGTGARRQPLEVYITTAGVSGEGYAWEMHELALQVMKGEIIDPSLLPVVFAAPDEEKWQDEDTWRAANPNYGVSVKPAYMRAEAVKAARSPRQENDFKRFHLNIWTEQVTRWLPMDEQGWRGCTADPLNPRLWCELAERMKGRNCWSGLDLSLTRDLSALCHAFPPLDDEDDVWTFLWRFWLPEATVEDQPLARKMRYRSFVDQGALTLTPGNVVDYDHIHAAILEDAKAFNIAWLGIDRYNASQLAIDLKDKHGLPVNWFGQGYLSMSPAAKGFERLVASTGMEHGNQPVAAWMARNASVERDAAGNIKPTKAKAADKIDGIVAAVMAYGGATTAPLEESPYADGRGLLFLA